MIIILTGYMGSGKSLAGKLLAKKLGFRFTDLDDLIAEQEKMSVPALFHKKGEVYFRKRERFYLETVLSAGENMVLASGGGTPCYGDNMELMLSAASYVFYLKARVDTLIQRLEKEPYNRPLIKDIKKEDLPEFIGKHLFERSYFYLKAPYVIAVDELQPEEIAAEIVKNIALDKS